MKVSKDDILLAFNMAMPKPTLENSVNSESSINQSLESVLKTSDIGQTLDNSVNPELSNEQPVSDNLKSSSSDKKIVSPSRWSKSELIRDLESGESRIIRLKNSLDKDFSEISVTDFENISMENFNLTKKPITIAVDQNWLTCALVNYPSLLRELKLDKLQGSSTLLEALDYLLQHHGNIKAYALVNTSKLVRKAILVMQLYMVYLKVFSLVYSLDQASTNHQLMALGKKKILEVLGTKLGTKLSVESMLTQTQCQASDDFYLILEKRFAYVKAIIQDKLKDLIRPLLNDLIRHFKGVLGFDSMTNYMELLMNCKTKNFLFKKQKPTGEVASSLDVWAALALELGKNTSFIAKDVLHKKRLMQLFTETSYLHNLYFYFICVEGREILPFESLFPTLANSFRPHINKIELTNLASKESLSLNLYSGFTFILTEIQTVLLTQLSTQFKAKVFLQHLFAFDLSFYDSRIKSQFELLAKRGLNNQMFSDKVDKTIEYLHENPSVFKNLVVPALSDKPSTSKTKKNKGKGKKKE